MNKRFLHLDFKGIVPQYKQLLKWLEFFKACGFDGLVFEFDCRIHWNSWPGAGMPVYTREQAQEIVAYAEKLGFETIPLMQIMGHLEWILGEECYANLRENNKFTLCPSQAEAVPHLEAWMREIREIFPHSQYIHLGADEVRVLGECPECQKKLAQLGKGNFYCWHAARMCRLAVDMGFRPMIWADMLLNEPQLDLQALPPETILVNWEYFGAGPYENLPQLQQTGHEVWGASAVKSAWYEHFYMMLNFAEDRLENVAGWNQYNGNVIHTFWGRPGNKWDLYPPWQMSLPVFIAAGNPAQWQAHPWHDRFMEFTQVFRGGMIFKLQKYLEILPTWPVRNELEKACLRYLILGVRYEIIRRTYCEYYFGRLTIDTTMKFVGKNETDYHRFFTTKYPKLQEDLKALMVDVAQFFDDNALVGKAEFIAEKQQIFPDLPTR